VVAEWLEIDPSWRRAHSLHELEGNRYAGNSGEIFSVAIYSKKDSVEMYGSTDIYSSKLYNYTNYGSK